MEGIRVGLDVMEVVGRADTMKEGCEVGRFVGFLLLDGVLVGGRDDKNVGSVVFIGSLVGNCVARVVEDNDFEPPSIVVGPDVGLLVPIFEACGRGVGLEDGEILIKKLKRLGKSMLPQPVTGSQPF